MKKIISLFKKLIEKIYFKYVFDIEKYEPPKIIQEERKIIPLQLERNYELSDMLSGQLKTSSVKSEMVFELSNEIMNYTDFRSEIDYRSNSVRFRARIILVDKGKK